MRHLLLLCFSLYACASWALAQSRPDQDVAEARKQCNLLKHRFQAVRGFPSTEPAKTRRESDFQELLKLHVEARKVHLRNGVMLQDSLGSSSGNPAALPIHELAVVGDCGGGWWLASLLIRVRENGAEYFEVGYVQTGQFLEGPASCTELTGWIQRTAFRYSAYNPSPGDELYVLGSVVMVREAPEPTAAVLQKLGYGVAVNAVSRACGDWILVYSPFGGYGFIHKDFVGATLHDEATLREKQSRAPSVLEQSVWALARAHFFPSDGNTKEAQALQTKVREASSGTDQGRCERFVGSCEVLRKDSVREERLEPDPKVSEIPVGPWWMLPTAIDAARLGVFRGAYVYTTGECDCCGCESCQTTLEVALEPLGTRERTGYLAASRRPPPSWFRALSREGCAKAEQAARKSPRWEVPRFAGDPKKPATKGEGTCIPGDDGSFWWQQKWHHPEMADMESDEVLRSYRVLKGRVVEVSETRVTYGSSEGGDLAWSASPLTAWRDLDGDGRPDALRPCQYGRYCTEAKGFTR